MFPIPLSPRLILTGIAAASLLATVGGLYWKGRHDAAEKLKPVIAAAQEGERQSDNVAKALDGHISRSNATGERADRATYQVQQAPGASTAIDPDRRAILCASLASVRGEPVCFDEGQVDPDVAGQVPRAENVDDDPIR